MSIKIIIGLGNYDKKYDNTPHNLGSMFVESILKNFHFKESFSTNIQKLYKIDGSLYLSIPKTYMNVSGQAVKELGKVLKITTINLVQSVIIAHDEVGLPMFKIDLKDGKINQGLGGHNGLRSIRDAFMNLGLTVGASCSFMRIRIGCNADARSKVGLAEYVLKPMNHAQMLIWKDVFAQETASILNQLNISIF